MGIPLTELLDIVRMLRGNVERVANEDWCSSSSNTSSPPTTKAMLPPAKGSAQACLTASGSYARWPKYVPVETEVARAMDKAINQYLGDLLGHMFRASAQRGPAK